MAEGIKLKGALKECIDSFPFFGLDLEVLIKEGCVQITSPESCMWLKSKTSLAEYFKWIGEGSRKVSGGFWAPVEKAFGIKRHSLRKLAGSNGNVFKFNESKDFLKIKPLILEIRNPKEKIIVDRHSLMMIKHLISTAKDEKPETNHSLLDNIWKLMTLRKMYMDKKCENQ